MESYSKRFDRKIKSIKMYAGGDKPIKNHYYDSNGHLALIKTSSGEYRNPSIKEIESDRLMRKTLEKKILAIHDERRLPVFLPHPHRSYFH